MSYLRPFAATCAVAIIAAQLNARPAFADGYNTRSGGFIVIETNSVSLLVRSKHRVHRYYGAPKVYHQKAKPKAYYYKAKPKVYLHKARPKVHYVKPIKRHHRSVFGHYKKRSSPYYIPQRYGIQHRNSHRGFSRHKY